MIGAVTSWSLAGLMLWSPGRPANLSFMVASGTGMTAISFILGHDLVYGGHIATHDTHGYNKHRNWFHRLDRGSDVPDRSVWSGGP